MAYKDVYILSRLCATVKIKSNYMVFILGVLCYLLNTYLWPYQVTRESRVERELIINF